VACAMRSLHRARVESGQRVAVVGGGTLGIASVAAAVHLGCEVGIAARHPHQVAAAEAVGGQPVEGHYDVVIEAAGTEPELRRQMRTKTGVSELESGAIKFSQAPTGSYGFIAPKQLGMALVTQSPDLLLERISSSSGSYEIHKLADGSGLLVGFVGNEAVPQIRASERPKSVRLSLYSNPSGNATRWTRRPGYGFARHCQQKITCRELIVGVE